MDIPSPSAMAPKTVPFRMLLKHPLSVMGLVSLGFFGVILIVLMGMDLTGVVWVGGPYGGLITYFVLPGLVTASAAFSGMGVFLRWRWYRRTGFRIEAFGGKERRWRLPLWGIVASFVWLVVSLFGTYKAYEFGDSTVFCGLACHQVMEPEYTAYLNSDHARVNCVDCHIGPGADWAVKAKITGFGQLVAVATGNYKTPIETPIHDLRPAQDTCEQCHWPGRFSGALVRQVTHYAPDDENTPTRYKLLIPVGGEDESDAAAAPGVHWHVSSRWKVEYLPADEGRQEIPYVRVTYAQGRREEYSTASFDRASLDESRLRTMDCLDCHNRPSHVFHSPNRALDESLDRGRIDPRLPGVKKALLALLEKPYGSRVEGEDAIRAGVDAWAKERGFSQADEKVIRVRDEVLRLFRVNFFPDHGVDYRAFIDNSGHFESKGCERCHDGRHKTSDGKKSINMECDTCHVLVGQATGVKEVAAMEYGRVEFKHPEDPVAPNKTCSSCHALGKGGGE